jgi:hypothetical protein
MNEVDPGLVTAAAWVLLLIPILPLAVAALFAPDALSEHLPTRERAVIAFRDFLLAAWVALQAGAYLFGWEIAPATQFGLAVMAYLAISIPSGVWLVLYFTNRFRYP